MSESDRNRGAKICTYPKCTSPPLKFRCPYCTKLFCSKHEQHDIHAQENFASPISPAVISGSPSTQKDASGAVSDYKHLLSQVPTLLPILSEENLTQEELLVNSFVDEDEDDSQGSEASPSLSPILSEEIFTPEELLVDPFLDEYEEDSQGSEDENHDSEDDIQVGIEVGIDDVIVISDDEILSDTGPAIPSHEDQIGRAHV